MFLSMKNAYKGYKSDLYHKRKVFDIAVSILEGLHLGRLRSGDTQTAENGKTPFAAARWIFAPSFSIKKQFRKNLKFFCLNLLIKSYY